MTLYFETTTWIAVGAAVSAVAIALVVAIVLMVLVLRSRRGQQDPDVERMLDESDARFEQMLEGLSREPLRAREESQRSRGSRASAARSTSTRSPATWSKPRSTSLPLRQP